MRPAMDHVLSCGWLRLCGGIAAVIMAWAGKEGQHLAPASPAWGSPRGGLIGLTSTAGAQRLARAREEQKRWPAGASKPTGTPRAHCAHRPPRGPAHGEAAARTGHESVAGQRLATQARSISGLACVHHRVLECTTGTRGQSMDAGVHWCVAPRHGLHYTTVGSRSIPGAPGTSLDPP